MDWIMCELTVIYLITAHLYGVVAQSNDPDIIGMAVAGCVGFVFLSVVLGILAVSFHWTGWFNNWMRLKGKVKMPHAYFRKKEEAKKRLISTTPAVSVASGLNGNFPPVREMNGIIPAGNVERDVTITKQTETTTKNYYTPFGNHAPVVANGTHYATKTQATKFKNQTTLGPDWHQRNNTAGPKLYEEKNASMELGEEGDDEFRIETEVVDNETLDVGPFKHDHSREIPMKGDVYADPYIYSSVDSSKKASRNFTKPATSKIATSVKTLDSEYSTVGDVKTTSFHEAMVHL